MEKNKNNRVKKNRKITIRLAIWTILWTISTAVAQFGPIFLWNRSSILTIIAIVTNFGLGIAMIIANIHHLKNLDELQQKIQLEAMGIALGVGVVAGLSYSLLDTTNYISSDAEISHLVIIMALTYMANVIIARIKYK